MDLYLVFGPRKIHKLFKSGLESSFYTKADQQGLGTGAREECAAKRSERKHVGRMSAPNIPHLQSGSGLTGVYPCCNLYTLTGCSLLYINYTLIEGYQIILIIISQCICISNHHIVHFLFSFSYYF